MQLEQFTVSRCVTNQRLQTLLIRTIPFFYIALLMSKTFFTQFITCLCALQPYNVSDEALGESGLFSCLKVEGTGEPRRSLRTSTPMEQPGEPIQSVSAAPVINLTAHHCIILCFHAFSCLHHVAA